MEIGRRTHEEILFNHHAQDQGLALRVVDDDFRSQRKQRQRAARGQQRGVQARLSAQSITRRALASGPDDGCEMATIASLLDAGNRTPALSQQAADRERQQVSHWQSCPVTL